MAKLKLEKMAKGAVQELFDFSLEKVLKNIGDPNTDEKKKRSITLKVDFIPQKGREIINVLATSKETLVSDNPVEALLVRKGTECEEFEQTSLFDEEANGENVINLNDRKEKKQ